MTKAPPSIRRFETLQIVAVAIGLMNGFAVIPDDNLRGIASAVVVLTLTFLVSRRRKNWPRWVFLGILAVGVPWMAWNGPSLLEHGYFVAAVAIGVTLMNAIAVVLLFMPESTRWVQVSRSPA